MVFKTHLGGQDVRLDIVCRVCTIYITRFYYNHILYFVHLSCVNVMAYKIFQSSLLVIVHVNKLPHSAYICGTSQSEHNMSRDKYPKRSLLEAG